MSIRRLTPADAEALHALRAAALLDAPLAFASAPGDDRLRTLDIVRQTLAGGPAAHFGAESAGALVGAAALLTSDRAKTAHKAFLVGMYVAPAARGRGLGRALLEAVIAEAKAGGARDLHLSVSEAAPAAVRLYRGAGFVAWGREPRGLVWQGRATDTLHMVLEL